jgi:4-hydroxybenzoate polyprenyltransferase
VRRGINLKKTVDLMRKKFIEVYRVRHWYYYLGFILLGFSLVSPLKLGLLTPLLLGAFLLAYAYSFNDFCDEREKPYYIFPLALTILMLPFLNFSQFILALFFLFIVTAYSGRSVRLKSKPFLSSLCNGIGFSILFLLGYSVRAVDFIALLFFLLFFSFNMVSQFIHEVVDLSEDKKNKIITTAVFLGEKNIKRLCYFFLLLAYLFSLYLFCLNVLNILLLFATVIFIAFFIYKIFNHKIDKKLRKEYRNLGVLLGLIYFIYFISF